MDPNATLTQMLEAIESEAWEDAQELIIALKVWLNRGGFAPAVSREQLAKMLGLLGQQVDAAAVAAADEE